MNAQPGRSRGRYVARHARPKEPALTGLATTRRGRYLLGGVALMGVSGLGLGSLASTALLSDTKTTTGANVAAGTISISQSGNFSTDLAASAMMPGDAQYSVLTVNNTGQASRVSASGTWSSAANTFTQNLTFQAVTVASAGATCAAANFSLGTATSAVTSGGSTTVTMPGAPNLIVGTSVTLAGFTNNPGDVVVTAVDNAAKTFTFANASATSGTGTVTVKNITTSTTSLPIFGSSASGQQAGDQAYAANSTQYYCFRLALPAAVTDNSGQTNTLTVTLNAEQTKNNP